MRALPALLLIAVLTAHLLAPDRALDATYLAAVALAVAWLLLGVLRGPARGSAAWGAIAAGVALWALGEVLWIHDVSVLGGDGLTLAIADAAYLLGYVPLAWGLLRLCRLRPGGDQLGVALDTAIVALVAAVALVELVLVPTLGPLAAGGWEQWGLGAYPVLDVGLLALAGRLLLAGPGNRAAQLLVAALVATTVADTAYAGLLDASAYAGGRGLDLLWLAGYALLAAAAAQPSAARLGDRDEPGPLLRLLIAGAAALTVPALAIVHGAGERPPDAITLVLACLLPVLVIGRAGLAVHQATRSRQRAERVEQQLTSILSLSPDLITIHDEDARVVEASAAAVPVLGLAPGALVGRTLEDLIHPDDYERIRRRFREAMVREEPGLPIEYRIRDAAGAWRTVEAAGTRITVGSGAKRLLVATRDVTDRRRAAEELRFQAQLLSAVDEVVIASDLEGRVVYFNAAAERMLGWSTDDVLGRSAHALLDPTDRVAAEAMAAGLAQGRTWSGQITLRCHDGTTYPALATQSPYYDAEGRFAGLIGTSVDISELEEARAHLARRAAQQTAVARLGQRALRTTNVEQVRRDAVGMVTDALAGTGAEVHFAAPDEEPAPTDGDAAQTLVVPVGGPEGPHGHLTLTTDDPAGLPPDVRPFLEGVANVVAAASDHHAVRRELEHQALHDVLTGLPNRTLLLDRIAQAGTPWAAHRFAVLALDLDGFKLVNEAIGHAAGDELLRWVAQRLDEVVRHQDTVARLGGDEFAVLCLDVADDAEAVLLAGRLRSALAAPFRIEGHDLAVTASVGIAVGGPGTDPERLLREADTALYRAKEGGRDGLARFDDGLRNAARRRLDLAAGLRAALDDGRIRVAYQPVVDLRTERMVGVEALARWGEGEDAVSPGEFIPVAEETGLIVPLGVHVLEQACADAAQWVAETDEPFLVSVNVSARELLHGRLAGTVARALEHSGLAPSRLYLELTETAFVGEPEAARAALEELRALGVRLAIDDFGTGYSSLTYLRQLPFDVVKIDRSFVQGLGADPQDHAIVAGAVELAHQFGLASIGEGVETREQLDELAALGCDLAQGFRWSPAVPPLEISRLLRTGLPLGPGDDPRPSGVGGEPTGTPSRGA